MGYQSCDTYSNKCTHSIDVLYESNHTIALKSDKLDTVWKTVDEIKQYGYAINGMTSYPISDGSGTRYINILVVMSK